MASVLSRLPLEVLIIILHYMPDLPSIYKLICASSRANTAFKADSTRILDGAIERSIPDFSHLVRMVAILGSFSSSSRPTFDELVRNFENLPEDVLTMAPTFSAFPIGMLGFRYVLLTAYRIETLQHICFVTLLENIHELMWSMAPKHNHVLKRSRAGVFFQGAAWYPPSWVERIRIERAFWKLVIYWNICAICRDLKEDDYGFRQYSAKIQRINPMIGPSIESTTCYQHEIEEMRCVLSTTQEILGCSMRSFEIFTPFAMQDYPKPCIRTGASFTNLKETHHWRFQEPRPMKVKRIWIGPDYGNEGLYHGQERHCTSERNTAFREVYWSIWRNKLNSGLNSHVMWFPDYLGLCIWDLKRLSYLGLATVYDKHLDMYAIDRNQRAPCNENFDCNGLIPERWRAVFIHELVISPGGSRRRLSKKYKTIIKHWNITRLGRGNILEGMRIYALRSF